MSPTLSARPGVKTVPTVSSAGVESRMRLPGWVQLSGPAPECGQHTEEVLLELGYDWEAIAALKDRGAIP